MCLPHPRQLSSNSICGNAQVLSQASTVQCTNIPQTSLKTEPRVKGGADHPAQSVCVWGGVTARDTAKGVYTGGAVDTTNFPGNPKSREENWTSVDHKPDWAVLSPGSYVASRLCSSLGIFSILLPQSAFSAASAVCHLASHLTASSTIPTACPSLSFLGQTSDRLIPASGTVPPCWES